MSRKPTVMNETDDINRLDLNLLRVFLAIMEEGNVTTAGARLNFAQSSMSHALSRLRKTLGNPLFVRSTTGMRPTPMAIRLAEPIANAFKTIQAALEESRTFAPETSERTFNLIMTDMGERIFLPKLMPVLARRAPKVSVVVHQMPRATYREALESGQADLAIGQLPPLHTDFYQQHLFDHDFLCFARAGHRIARRFTLNDYLEAEHLVVASPAIAEVNVKKALGLAAARRRVVLQVRHYLVAPPILAKTDMIAALPRGVGEVGVLPRELIKLPLPFEVDPIVMRQFWHERTNHDPACVWLRKLLAELFQGAAVADTLQPSARAQAIR